MPNGDHALVTTRSTHVRLSAVGAAALLAVATLSACSETSGSGTPAAAGGGSAASSSGSSGSGGSAAPAGSITDLASTLVAATSRGTTVHLTLSTSGGGTSADSSGSGEGDVQTADGGTTKAFSFAIGSGSSAISMVYVGGAGYVKLPASERTDAAKPWAKITDTSSNPVVKALSTAFDQIDSQTSLSQYAALLKSASNFEATGPTQVDGATVQGYSFDVDPTSLPNAKQLGSVLDQLGPIPTTMAVDDQGRPVQVIEKISLQGQTITTTVSLSDYGKAVDIAAPPADQTSTD